MEYRKLPRGEEKLSVIGLGSGSLGLASEEEIEAIIKEAIKRGINFFDLCAGNHKVYKPFGKAIKGIREKVHFQLHFGAVYKVDGEYSWSRDLNKIKNTIKEELELLNTDYIDYGFLHCIDDFNDLEDVKKNGIIDYLIELKNKGYELLLFLMQNADIVFSKETLYERIWGYDALGDNATVAVHINRLREKI